MDRQREAGHEGSAEVPDRRHDHGLSGESSVADRSESVGREGVEEYFPPEEITVAKDGCLMVRTEHAEDVWLYGTLLSFGADVKVLEPEHLADAIRERAATNLPPLREVDFARSPADDLGSPFEYRRFFELKCRQATEFRDCIRKIEYNQPYP
ncbi:WYL domain-containing protein [Cohnella sp. AR92]|uniref:WYL domain-containing protein n=1 Tax=Cohnella sp. AR92 TaxID=648716 RepID=UPI000F8D8A52|nr:WYL domain-containing protein [Cohnella sp. AR92]RUS47388.1 WYL domain-containing protein [Cohnella sp. AR92]